MSFLTTLFSNDKVKDLALGTLKKTMVEGKVKYIVIEMQENMELDMQQYGAEIQPVVMSSVQLASIEKIMNEMAEKMPSLEAIIAEQEAKILLQESIIKKYETVLGLGEDLPENPEKPIEDGNSTESAGEPV